MTLWVPSSRADPTRLFDIAYDHPSQSMCMMPGRGDQLLSCVLTGLVIGLLVLQLSRRNAEYKDAWNAQLMAQQLAGVSGRLVKSVVKGAASARLAIGATPPLPEGTKPLSECKWLDASSAAGAKDVAVADCAEGKYKEMSEEERAEVDATFRSLVGDEKDRVLMLYAAWCNHCKQQMPAFVDAASTSGAQFVICHAEAMQRTSFMPGSESVILPLEYFPTFIIKKHSSNTNELYEANLSEVGEFAKTGKVPPSAKLKAKVDAEVKEEPKADSKELAESPESKNLTDAEREPTLEQGAESDPLAPIPSEPVDAVDQPEASESLLTDADVAQPTQEDIDATESVLSKLF